MELRTVFTPELALFLSYTASPLVAILSFVAVDRNFQASTNWRMSKTEYLVQGSIRQMRIGMNESLHLASKTIEQP